MYDDCAITVLTAETRGPENLIIPFYISTVNDMQPSRAVGVDAQQHPRYRSTVADQDLQIRGSLVIQTLRKKAGGGGISEKILSALWASVWSKNKGGGGQVPLEPSHGSTIDQGG